MSDPRCRCTCPGATVWVTGRPLADRLAAAYALAERLLAQGRRVTVLDRYDDLSADAAHLGLAAEVLARNGLVAIVPCATDGVEAVRSRHEASGTRYVELSVTDRTSPEESALAALGRIVTHD
ncbi:hypothetical protein BN159_0765 [Streptomyces davaonensis JCM 4913]|uniref:Uncharacterized protein n=1 Tax=Streptomyces davaonensis (strain DSM 101723 / JCM 4913 / KCC S-0913 / 768) TaxID=1214101 RepID=K4QXN2_STRDJ|nr:hypothetical protein [Streptomyces davaonensis]CCK25144.1 hypothetical protein BN159_0765 [Streptomyces davaonensis JCM 4913]